MSMDHVLSPAQQAADSPFLPGTHIQFAWDSVSLTSALSCPRQYYYRIILGLVPNNPNYAIALVFGILFHRGVEIYHKNRAQGYAHEVSVINAVGHLLDHPATATLPTDTDIDEMAEERDEDDDGMTFRNSKIRTRYYLIRAVVWYLEQYANDPCKTIILPSGAAAVEVSFRVPLPIDVGGHQLLLCGHIDRGIEFNDYLYVSDYKTTKSITKQWRDLFQLSHQMTGYTSAGKIIWHQPVRGTMVDAVALQVGQVRFGRHFLDKTEGQITEYFDILKYASDGMAKCHEEKNYPMNTSSCFLCDYKSICMQPPEQRDRHIRTSWTRRPGWNPLENR